jgi:hypothetical protein
LSSSSSSRSVWERIKIKRTRYDKEQPTREELRLVSRDLVESTQCQKSGRRRKRSPRLDEREKERRSIICFDVQQQETTTLGWTQRQQ